MKYSELIRELEYWQYCSGKEDPEVVMWDGDSAIEIDSVRPSKGVNEKTAIGLQVWT